MNFENIAPDVILILFGIPTVYVLSRALFAVVVLLLCGAPRTALAESTLLYQGQVFGAEGAFTGTTDLSFRLFDAPLWWVWQQQRKL